MTAVVIIRAPVADYCRCVRFPAERACMMLATRDDRLCDDCRDGCSAALTVGEPGTAGAWTIHTAAADICWSTCPS